MKIGVIGGGAMGEAIVSALLRSELLPPDDLSVADVIAERVELLHARHSVRGASSNIEASGDADYVIIALKPQDFDAAAPALAGHIGGGRAALISIMAGVTIRKIGELIRHAPVVRAAPNTPAQIGEGMTVWTATPEVSAEQREDVRRILACLGKEAYVSDERYVDMAIAVSSSGPGYVFLFIEALIDAAVHIGLGRELATEMVLQTVAGAARFAQETRRHPAELRNLVTSPGGTTAEGLLVFEAAGLRAAATEAVLAAYERSKALGEASK